MSGERLPTRLDDAGARPARFLSGAAVLASVVTLFLAVLVYRSGCDMCIKRPALFSVQLAIAGAAVALAVVTSYLSRRRRPREVAGALMVVTIVEVAWVLVCAQIQCSDTTEAACNGAIRKLHAQHFAEHVIATHRGGRGFTGRRAVWGGD